MKIKEVTRYLENIAPSMYQESYDNSGLIVGNLQAKITGVLICLDSTEEIIDEAKKRGCNLVIAHHPIVFKGLRTFTGKNYVERTVIKAIKNDIAIYAIHTNLDNVHTGVNAKIAEKIGLVNTRILSPKKNVIKLECMLPVDYSEIIKNQIFEAGGGLANGMKDVSYASVGAGTLEGDSLPLIKLEILLPIDRKGAIISILRKNINKEHFTYHVTEVNEKNPKIGSGMIGELKEPMKEKNFLEHLKKTMNVGCVKYTNLLGKNIKKVAVCGGAGGFLLNTAKSAKA
ncbi:MAG: Nif3-like dinuclear metal center hexameric protein, partial [Saprospiraceae bacterium]